MAVVTGAARGLGKATADRLAADGADVALLDQQDLSETRSAVEATGRRCVELTGDVSDPER